MIPVTCFVHVFSHSADVNEVINYLLLIHFYTIINKDTQTVPLLVAA